MSVADIGRMLAIDGKSFADFPRALEFGCGCGRILLHMGSIAEKTALFAVDIDAESVGWVQEHVPWVAASVNDGLPPLAFADGHFDLVFNHSVFTHIDENYQDAWLGELARVTRAGGLVVLSVAGMDPFMELVGTWRKAGADPTHLTEQFRTKGFIFIADDGWVGGPFPDFYHSAFHAPWYVFRHWSNYFAVKAYVPRGSLGYSDYVLLERRTGPSPSAQRLWDASPPPPPQSPTPAPKASIARQIVRRVKRYLGESSR